MKNKTIVLKVFLIFLSYIHTVKAETYWRGSDYNYYWCGDGCPCVDGGNSVGCPAETVTVNNTDGTTSTTTLYYLQDGTTIDHEKTSVDSSSTVTYYENGHKTFERTSTPGVYGSPQYQGTYYDAEGNEIGKESYTTTLGYDSSGEPNSMIQEDKFLDENNNIVKYSVQKMAYTDDSMEFTQEDLVFSNDGTSFGRHWDIDPMTGNQTESLVQYKYDSNGEIIETTKVSFDSTSLDSIEDYITYVGAVYDAQGNKIKDAQIIADKNFSNITIATGDIDGEIFTKDSEKNYDMGSSLSFILSGQMILNTTDRTLPQYNNMESNKVYDIEGNYRLYNAQGTLIGTYNSTGNIISDSSFKTAGVSPSAPIIHKRIYSIDEALEVTSSKGNLNTFIIKYR